MITIMVLPLLLAACLPGGQPAPVEELPQPPASPAEYYVVETGDTLYSIAWRYNMDFRRLAAANRIASPYRIRKGQKIVLREAAITRSAPKETYASSKKSPSGTTSTRVAKPSSTTANTKVSAWKWPLRGKIIERFSTLTPVHKGIDIAGRIGEPVNNTANGRVVYAGSGIRGYGRLVIIKHNERYLSAYAHNRRILVREGQSVTAGQQIGEVGEIKVGHAGLHFEIRKDGKPVNPLSYLSRD